MEHRPIITALVCIVAWACDDGGPQATADAAPAAWSGTAVLAAPEEWQPVDAAGDPFDDRPDPVDCPAHGAQAEDGIFEVETDICRYATVARAIPVDLRAGDVIEATVWHLELWASERTQGHVALMLGDRLLWEQWVPIPGQEAVYPVAVAIEEAAPAGTPLYFHVHNHGANSWRLLEVEGRRE